MRTSVLSRSVIAVASMAIGSVALAATPATAVTSSGITRDQVIAGAQYLRETEDDDAKTRNLETIAQKACGVAAGETLKIQDFGVGNAGGSADGFVLRAAISTPAGDGGETFRSCVFGAVATADPAMSLSGTASFDVATAPAEDAVASTALTPLSDNVFVTAPVTVPIGATLATATLSATGNATRSFNVTTTKKVSDKKTKAEKKAAKKKYDKALKTAKSSFTKALKKAGKSAAKKAAAKKAYSTKKVRAKADYKKAIADFRIVSKTTPTTENKPFTVNAGIHPRD